MTNTDFSLLYNQIREIAKNKTEEELKKFLVEHIKEFPENLQKKLVFLFFEEALSQTASDADQVVYEIKKEGLKIANELKQQHNELEDKSKAKKIKESLDN